MPADLFRSELEQLNKKLTFWRYKMGKIVERQLTEAEACLTKMA